MYIFSLFIERYGYLLLFVLGFMEFAGIPSVTIPALLAVGAVAAKGGIHPVWSVVVLTAGALIAETMWYTVARRLGRPLVHFACGLAANPSVCVFGVEDRLRDRGPFYIVVAKFIPGAGSVPAIASGFTKIAYRRFLTFDSLALVIWGGFYVGAGWLLDDKVEAAVEWLAARGSSVIGALAMVFIVALVWRFVKVRRHKPLHADH